MKDKANISSILLKPKGPSQQEDSIPTPTFEVASSEMNALSVETEGSKMYEVGSAQEAYVDCQDVISVTANRLSAVIQAFYMCCSCQMPQG